VLNMTQRYFDGRVPDPGALSETDADLLNAIDDGFDEVGASFDACKFRAALQGSMALATRVNQYLEDTSPWLTVKDDLAAAGRSLYVAIQAINGLKILFAPVLPFASESLHKMLAERGQLFGVQSVQTFNESERSHLALTYDGSSAVGKWERTEIEAGRRLPSPTPLFKKLDSSVVEDELARLGQQI
jgi:methionyl-tRNA synthetase